MLDSLIFFSYSRKDSDFVIELGKQLRESGATIWLDQFDIEAGTNWDEAIQKALKMADTLIVVLSKTSVASKNVSDEYSYALEEGKRVVPVLLEPCDIPFRLRRLQYADFTKSPADGIKTLIETLDLKNEVAQKLSDAQPISNNAMGRRTERELSKSKKRQSYVIIGALMLAIIVFAFYYIYSRKQSPLQGNQITVLVHDVYGKDRLVLPNRGQVKLIYGDANVIETINSKGEATFKQIPDVFFNAGNQVEIHFYDPQGEPYRAVKADSLYELTNGNHISLAVQLTGLNVARGIVKDFVSGDPIDSVRISISGVETYSNSFGEYELQIPPDQQRKFQTVRAFKDGYQLYEETDIPIQTDQELPIVLKPKIK